ncbi:tetratricopeptide repeat protein [Telmatospirillum siberiense]|uniref:tetratricopeptide repeat-containing glycosyltransferase family protein n=1 Tax=Telmatospirillum siberiense TaxID=382514 RepID=UPI001F530E55|nr:tetratricopeptide repeat-containing glycosyltransferase family protein [Telmatospirillum siberiense]
MDTSAPPQDFSVGEILGQVAGLIQAKKYDEVLGLIQNAMTKDPTNGDLINAKGCVFSALGRQRDALKCYRDALEFNATGSGLWSNLGTAFKHLKYFSAAIACHRRAIDLSGEEPFLHHNLGLCYAEAGQHGEAIMAFNRALALQPTYHLARWDRARSFLFLGNYRQGWADYEVRLISGQIPKRPLPGRKWSGEPYPGERLVILTEQGFGDTLWILRYLSTVKGLGGELVIECQPALCAFVASLGIADQVIAHGQPLPDAAYHCHQCSLPGLFTPDLSRLSTRAYLSPPTDRKDKFKPHFEKAAGRLKIGIVWSGSMTFGRNADRALPLERLLLALDFPGVQLYSLQKGLPEQELASLPQGRRPIIDLAAELSDFADTAAAVSGLDLVIMTDSAVAHLAGGLGIPVWVLLGYSAHWLWLLNRTDCPWYPSTRLFRPRVEGDWDYVLDNVAAELLKLVPPR